VRACVRVCASVCICVCICVYLRACVCICVCERESVYLSTFLLALALSEACLSSFVPFVPCVAIIRALARAGGARHTQGVLKGFDQTVNIVLAECSERVYSSSKPVEVVELGVFLIRGDNMCAVAPARGPVRHVLRRGPCVMWCGVRARAPAQLHYW
jgi:small nuclear ribonucleoprotein (snRNP)-like protein